MNRTLASLRMLAITLPSPPLATAQKLVEGGSGIVGDMEVPCVDRSLGTIALC
jgi:hypothetical protein